MNLSIPESGLKSRLVRQLVVLGEEKKKFLDSYFPVYGKKRNEMNSYLSNYTRAVEKLLESAEDNEEVLNNVVLIGSQITISYISEQSEQTESFTIDFPNKANAEYNRISFLSPVGYPLLLTEPGDVVTVETPAGVVRIRVESIRLTPEARGAWIA
ncbi:GreA/GreB family elongation factor [Paenibacillus sp. NPDC058174]|uniref:GreA/GreB family elongation factor n=1 Tax=Paenibacillus sp. NPDC058174 TaxID=3346366 RepID=UPI0036D808B8